MLVTRQGIICRSVKYGESSLILDIFTGDVGMRSYIISGVRSKRAKSKQATLQVMNLVELVAYDKGADRSSLLRIKEVKYDYIYRAIPFNIIKSSVGIFLLELSRNSIKASDDNQGIYEFIKNKLLELDQAEHGLAHFHINYIIAFASLLGFGMNNNYDEVQYCYFHLVDGTFVDRITDHRYCMDKEVSHEFSKYLSGVGTDVPKQYRKAILNRLIDFYRYHIDQFGELKSLEVLYSLYGD